MIIDARFNLEKGTDDHYRGVSRRGVYVRIAASPEIDEQIRRWNGVLTVSVSREWYEAARGTNTVVTAFPYSWPAPGQIGAKR